jgi:hypothetical protein
MTLEIKELSEMPKGVKSASPKKSGEVRKLIEQFDAKKMQYAEIPATKEHTIRGLRVSIGRILSSDKRTDIEVFVSTDSKAIILKRKK